MFEKIDCLEEDIQSNTQDIERISALIDIFIFVINQQQEMKQLKKETQRLKLTSPEVVKNYLLSERFP